MTGGQDGVRPCEVFFCGDVRALILEALGLESDDIESTSALRDWRPSAELYEDRAVRGRV